MIKLRQFESLLFLTLLAGCGDDVSKSKKRPSNSQERTSTNIEAERPDNQRSHLHREKGQLVLTYQEESSKTLSGDLSQIFYRSIPSIEIDDEGSKRNVRTVTDHGRPSVPCGGTTLNGILNRVKDCAEKNLHKASWDGIAFGSAGEGHWKLVSRSEEGTEIWLDGRSGMLWSDLQKTNEGMKIANWCKASGSVEFTVSVDCKKLGDLESLCANTKKDPHIKWRLPTRNDFLQGDLNGLRRVLKKEADQKLWTATLRAAAPERDEAWTYDLTEGTLSAAKITEEKYVRCIGVAAP